MFLSAGISGAPLVANQAHLLIATALADGCHAQEHTDGRGRELDAVLDGRGEGERVGGPVLLVDDVDLLVVGGHGVDPGEVRADGNHAWSVADADVGEQDLLGSIDNLYEAGVGVGRIGIGAIDGEGSERGILAGVEALEALEGDGIVDGMGVGSGLLDPDRAIGG